MRLVLATIAILLLMAAGFGGMAWEARYFQAPGPSPTRTVVVITPGSGLASVAQKLARAGVVQNALLFDAGVIRRAKSAQLKAGEYGFPAHASEALAVEMLVAHKVIEHRITIPEGYTSDMAVALLDSDKALAGKAPDVAEGTLLPETYLFELGTSRAQLIARMQKAQAALLAQLWPARKPGLPFQSVDEALNLASIVVKETAIASERPHVAAEIRSCYVFSRAAAQDRVHRDRSRYGCKTAAGGLSNHRLRGEIPEFDGTDVPLPWRRGAPGEV